MFLQLDIPDLLFPLCELLLLASSLRQCGGKMLKGTTSRTIKLGDYI